MAWLEVGDGVRGPHVELCPHPLPTAGRMYLFYGNKTSVQFQNFSPTVVHPGDLQTHILSVDMPQCICWNCPSSSPTLPLMSAVPVTGKPGTRFQTPVQPIFL